jgi:peptidoglycan hydrolase-like protein with peptidoglycan-binding domain
VDGIYAEELEQAVRRLQKKNNLVTPGLCCKTGFGLVEEKTRAYLNKNLSCEPYKPRAQLSCRNVSCPNISQELARGKYDPEGVLGEVGQLQCFLAGQGILAPVLVTGAFGPSTERALLSYQAKNGIAQTGTVNNQTRATIAKCGKATAGAQSKSQKYSFYIKPASGDAPLEIALSFALNGTNCSSYSVDWGDGTAPLAHDAGRPATCAQQPVTLFEKHTYVKAGSYTVTLKHGQDTLGRIPVVNQTQITVR